MWKRSILGTQYEEMVVVPSPSGVQNVFFRFAKQELSESTATVHHTSSTLV